MGGRCGGGGGGEGANSELAREAIRRQEGHACAPELVVLKRETVFRQVYLHAKIISPTFLRSFKGQQIKKKCRAAAKRPAK